MWTWEFPHNPRHTYVRITPREIESLPKERTKQYEYVNKKHYDEIYSTVDKHKGKYK